jgi:hypothetical protein
MDYPNSDDKWPVYGESKNVNDDDSSINQTENYLFFTHQYRLKHSLIGSINKLFEKSNIDFEIPKNKFSNNSIMCLTIKYLNVQDIQLVLKLVYSGDSKSNKPNEFYWTTETGKKIGERNPGYLFGKYGKEYITVPFAEIKEKIKIKDFCDVFKIDINNFNITNKKINCYFIRHGEAEHNTDKNELTRHMKYNTQLTLGDEQITALQDAGKELNKILNGNKINAVLVSDLLRTQQTAGFLLTEITDYNSNTPIFVMPCLHEKKTIDSKRDIGIAKENISTCRDEELIIKDDNGTIIDYTDDEIKTKCSSITINNKKSKINWKLYELFYAGSDNGIGYRDQDNKDRYECSYNHFLGIFFNNKTYIDSGRINLLNAYKRNDYTPRYKSQDENTSIVPNLGGKKRRQTKKHRVMKSKKVRRVKKHNKKSKKVKRRSNKRKA